MDKQIDFFLIFILVYFSILQLYFNCCILIWIFFPCVFVKADFGFSCSRSPINTKIFCLDFKLLISRLKDIWIRFGLNYFFLLFEGNTIKAETRSFLLNKVRTAYPICVSIFSKSQK